MIQRATFGKAFGYAVRQRAKGLGYTLRRVAYIAGISFKTMTKIAWGKCPHIEMAFCIAAALKCTLDDLVPKSPVSETPRRRLMTIGVDGVVQKYGTSRRTMFKRAEKARGFKHPKNYFAVLNQMRREEQLRASKIRTRAEVAREKARAAQKRASAA